MTYSRGRATLYRGIKMRSRLEASFAATLDQWGVAWTYEPQCFADATGQYLPDFRVVQGIEVKYMEIKPPTADTSAALLKMHIIRSSESEANLFVWVPTGAYPNQRFTVAGSCEKSRPCNHCFGIEFRDERMVPSINRQTIGGRARRDNTPTDPRTGRATIGGRARRDTQYITPKEQQ